MKLLRALLLSAITLAFVIVLNSRFADAPPFGSFLDPFGGFWQNAEQDPFGFSPNEKIPGLKAAATVSYDERRVPHIFAENDHDLYFLQGFVTARDRLWQMEFQTHAAGARLSEIFGEKALGYDRKKRRMGLNWAADNTMALLEKDADAYGILKDFTDGINAWISQLSEKDYPIEYKLLDYAPEPWTVYKTVLLQKYMADMLAGYSTDIEATQAWLHFGKDTFNKWYPASPDSIDPVIPLTQAWDFEPVQIDTPVNFSPQWVSGKLEYPKPDPQNGSNNWAVSGSKTKNGFPILASDPHLKLRLPSIWYEIQLHSPLVNCYGVSLPGAPGIIIGFNENVAWGITNSGRDVLDWYKIDFKDSGCEEYKYGNQWLKTEKRIEEIKIKGNESLFDTLLITKHGPVVFDNAFSEEGSPLYVAARWMAHEPGNELMTFHRLNRAKNHADYREALSTYISPGQNFVFAARDGDIAITQQGKFPVKWPGQGRTILDGSDPQQAWQAFIPFEQNPHILNPSRGFVSSANQHPTGPSYPYDISGNYEYDRNRRLNERLTALSGISPEDMMKLQQDNFNYYAADALPLLLSNLERTKISSDYGIYLGEIERWDYYNNLEIRAAAIWESWSKKVFSALWDDEMRSTGWPMDYPDQNTTYALLRKNPMESFVDNINTPETESLGQIATQALLESFEEIKSWETGKGIPATWAAYKGTEVPHLISLLRPFGRFDIPIGGNKHILNATNKTHGPSWRMVVELGPELKAWGVIPGGAEGNPGSRFYDHMVLDWAAGEYFPLHLFKPGATESVKFSQTLTPTN